MSPASSRDDIEGLAAQASGARISGPGEHLDMTRPHAARMYDYYLGGKTNYASDRKAAIAALKVNPCGLVTARENRAFMQRATRYAADRLGIRQFLDIGTGIPTSSDNLHEVAQRVDPSCRVVYVDNDEIVLAYARALLASTPEGATAFVQGDAREPETVLCSREVADTLDLTQPVALSLVALLHFVTDEMGAHELVRRYLEPLAPGSCLILSHATPDFDPDPWPETIEVYAKAGIPAQVRSYEEVERFFDGLELVEPGLVCAHRWRSADEPDGRLPGMIANSDVQLWTGIGIKP